ncbi:MAG: DinB family protein [Chloroflexi bacterium]|nr:DinB family protein [Chloroflexota bacterium]
MSIDHAPRILECTPDVLTALVRGASGDALTLPVGDGWSVRHVVAHVLDVEQVIYTDRISRMLGEDRPFIRSIDPLARMNERGLLARDVASLLSELTSGRPAAVTALRALSAQQLARTGQHDEAGEITVANLVHQWAYHDLMHLKQAASILQLPLVEAMGNTRKFYDI